MPALRANLKLEVASTREFPGERKSRSCEPHRTTGSVYPGPVRFPSPAAPSGSGPWTGGPGSVAALWGKMAALALEDLEREKYMPAGVVGFMSQPG